MKLRWGILGAGGIYNEKELEVKPVDRYIKETKAFARAMLSGQKPPVSGEDGQYVSKVTGAFYKSSKTKRFEDIE